MATAVKISYPVASANTVAITCSVASLASSTSWAGQASTAVDNTTNNDLDHLVSGSIKLGTSPTGGQVSVYAYAPTKIASGTPTYPDSITGTDAAKTMTSANVANASLAWLWTGNVDAVTGRVLDMPPRSVAQAFGGTLPPFWGLFVTQSSGAALDSTAGNHFFHYARIQAQTV